MGASNLFCAFHMDVPTTRQTYWRVSFVTGRRSLASGTISRPLDLDGHVSRGSSFSASTDKRYVPRNGVGGDSEDTS